ncbi:MAG: crotonase/enoyl-CoA hydratase family protein, partial [Acidimicrobiia bacterium]
MEYTCIEVEHRGHVAVLWLDRPDKLNAFGPEMWEEIPLAVRSLDEDENVRAIVVAGRGRAFTAGLDLAAYGASLAQGSDLGGEEPAGVTARQRLRLDILRMQDTMSVFADVDTPTIAAVHGWCLGAGMDLITACDIRICAADAVFGVRETRIAMAADVGTLQRLPRIIPAGFAAELIYTGKDIDAERAREIGLVNSVEPDAEAALAAAIAIADDIAANAPLAVRGSKHMVRANDGRTVGEALELMALWNSAYIHSEDLVEAMAAHLEGR